MFQHGAAGLDETTRPTLGGRTPTPGRGDTAAAAGSRSNRACPGKVATSCNPVRSTFVFALGDGGRLRDTRPRSHGPETGAGAWRSVWTETGGRNRITLVWGTLPGGHRLDATWMASSRWPGRRRRNEPIRRPSHDDSVSPSTFATVPSGGAGGDVVVRPAPDGLSTTISAGKGGRLWMADHRGELFAKPPFAINAEHTSHPDYFLRRAEPAAAEPPTPHNSGTPVVQRCRKLAGHRDQAFGDSPSRPYAEAGAGAAGPGYLGLLLRFVPGRRNAPGRTSTGTFHTTRRHPTRFVGPAEAVDCAPLRAESSTGCECARAEDLQRPPRTGNRNRGQPLSLRHPPGPHFSTDRRGRPAIRILVAALRRTTWPCVSPWDPAVGSEWSRPRSRWVVRRPDEFGLHRRPIATARTATAAARAPALRLASTKRGPSSSCWTYAQLLCLHQVEAQSPRRFPRKKSDWPKATGAPSTCRRVRSRIALGWLATVRKSARCIRLLFRRSRRAGGSATAIGASRVAGRVSRTHVTYARGPERAAAAEIVRDALAGSAAVSVEPWSSLAWGDAPRVESHLCGTTFVRRGENQDPGPTR